MCVNATGCRHLYVDQLARYRWQHVPADGRYSQLRDNPWMCETHIQVYRLTTSPTRWQITTHVRVQQSTIGLLVCESSKYTRNQRLVAPLEARMSLPISDETPRGCDY